jgi:hypothetical protein
VHSLRSKDGASAPPPVGAREPRAKGIAYRKPQAPESAPEVQDGSLEGHPRGWQVGCHDGRLLLGQPLTE